MQKLPRLACGVYRINDWTIHDQKTGSKTGNAFLLGWFHGT